MVRGEFGRTPEINNQSAAGAQKGSPAGSEDVVYGRPFYQSTAGLLVFTVPANRTVVKVLIRKSADLYRGHVAE